MNKPSCLFTCIMIELIFLWCFHKRVVTLKSVSKDISHRLDLSRHVLRVPLSLFRIYPIPWSQCMLFIRFIIPIHPQCIGVDGYHYKSQPFFYYFFFLGSLYFSFSSFFQLLMKRDHSPERRSDKRGEERSLNLSPRRKDSRSPIPSRRDSRSPPRRRREDRSRRERSSRERSSRRERSPRDRSSRRERSPRDKSSRRERSPQDRSRDRSSRRDRSRSSRREDRRDNRTDTRRRYQPDETMTEIAGIPILPGESFFA
ncbi:hypothetical protein BDB01DRAFT_262470 [Pilobolus umbonatus]|nr:hypothetical protein BDB01DRAFT_262470 [Pilobolus umbonatus]